MSRIKRKEKKVLEERKAWNIKKYVLVALQALCGALISICFFVFNDNAKMYLTDRGNVTDYSPSFAELYGEYLESDIYALNLDNAVSTVLRYVAIREQMEDKGIYSGEKEIDIGKFANRASNDVYEGPSVTYRLDDLIKWGQKALGSSEFYCSYEFYTLKEYCDFFSIDYDQYVAENSIEDDGKIITSFETLKNQYLTVEGFPLEHYASNLDEYQELVSNLQKTANDIYSNYSEYVSYNDMFSEENTNLRYAVAMTQDGSKVLYTNESRLNKGCTDLKIETTFKNNGEYLFAYPGTLHFVTNTPLIYDTIREIVIDEYSYSFPDDTKIWIALNTSYPVKDYFYINSIAFYKTARLIPWIVTLGTAAFVAFVALSVLIVQKERKIYNPKMAPVLGELERMPIEIGTMFFVLLLMLLYLGETMFIGQAKAFDTSANPLYIIASSALVGIDIFVVLLFAYGFIRRVICKNLLEGSIYSVLSVRLSKYTGGIKRWMYKIYDSGSVAVKTWVSYIVFLLINVFGATMLFFSSKPILSFVLLFVFDTAVGAVMFNRNWERKKILDGIIKISEGDYNYKIDNVKMHGENRELAGAVNDIALGLGRAVEISIKDEKLKADLITNVSHDIKTPLTSIINYVDLLKRTDIENDTVKKYIAVLDEKSQRLKQLTFDLVEASKISSGNIAIDFIRLNFNEFIKQAVGEFEEKFEEKGLELVINLPKTATYVMVDPRHMWRVIENLLNNIYKYALPSTRVYLDMISMEENGRERAILSIKNISGQQLNIPAEELTERFIRGDVSRSTEGSGLGLSIAKSLTNIQKGDFDIYLDGDLFKVTISFDICE